jgi:galactokinase
MDQMACRFGRPASALLIDCRRLDHRPVPLQLAGHALVITDSGVRRRLGDSAYNQRRRECERGVDFLCRHDPTLEALRDVTPGFLAAHEENLPADIAARCRHVVEENDRVLAAAAALERGDLPHLGALMTASHASLRDLYAASHPVLDQLVAAACSVPGVLGSRLTGAGFGGCTVTLCTADAVAPLCRLMEEVCGELGVSGSCRPLGTPAAAAVLEDTS